MAAESPKKGYRFNCNMTRPQPYSEKSLMESVVDFFSDVVPQAYSGTQKVEDKEKIQWVRFEDSDCNDISKNPDLYKYDTKGLPLLLILGYSNGVQIWHITANGEAHELMSIRQGPVRILRVLPTPDPAFGNDDDFASKRPLVAIVDSSSAGQPYCGVKFISLKTGDEVHTISFKTLPIQSIECNRRFVVIVFSEKLCLYDSCQLNQLFWITSCYPCPGPNVNPIALSTRWLAYADKRLVPMHQSCGGMSGDGAQSYAATVISAAKGAFKGLSMFGEAMVSSVTGNKAQHGNKKLDHMVLDNGVRPGIVSVVDIQNVQSDHFNVNEDNDGDGLMAHFHAHANEPVAAMTFDPTGTLLVTACKLGHNFHIFRLMAHPCSSSLGAVHHLYTLHRGDTTAKVIDITFSTDSRWVTVSTHRGTTHIFPITPYGGSVNVRTHCQPHIVNRASRFHKSAGLDEIEHSPVGRRSPVLSSSPGSSSGQYDHYPSLIRQNTLNNNMGNPRLPPYPHPTTIYPAYQIKQPINLTINPGGKTSSPTHSPPGTDNIYSVSVKFSTPRMCVMGSPKLAIERREGGKRPVESLFIMAQSGTLVEYVLEPRPKIGADKVTDESNLDLGVAGRMQWTLQRPKNSPEQRPPLPSNSPLILAREAVATQQPTATDLYEPAPISRQDSKDSLTSEHNPKDDLDQLWLSQVEIVTHAGPHRRLWMGPQFSFKTYQNVQNTTVLSSNSSALLSQSPEANMAAMDITGDDGDLESLQLQPTRSNPVTMPTTRPAYRRLSGSDSSPSPGRGGQLAPLMIEAGSFDQSPHLIDVYSDWAESTVAKQPRGSDDIEEDRLKETLADAMVESPVKESGPVSFRKEMGRSAVTVAAKKKGATSGTAEVGKKQARKTRQHSEQQKKDSQSEVKDSRSRMEVLQKGPPEAANNRPKDAGKTETVDERGTGRNNSISKKSRSKTDTKLQEKKSATEVHVDKKMSDIGEQAMAKSTTSPCKKGEEKKASLKTNRVTESKDSDRLSMDLKQEKSPIVELPSDDTHGHQQDAVKSVSKTQKAEADDVDKSVKITDTQVRQSSSKTKKRNASSHKGERSPAQTEENKPAMTAGTSTVGKPQRIKKQSPARKDKKNSNTSLKEYLDLETKTETKDNTVNDDTTNTDTKADTVNDDTTNTDTKADTVNDDTTKTDTKADTVNDDTTKTDTKADTVNDDTTKTDTKANTVNDDTTKTDTKDNTVNDDTTKTDTKADTVNDDTTKTDTKADTVNDDITKTETKDNTVNDDTTKTDTKDNTVNDDTTKTDTKDNSVNDDTTKTDTKDNTVNDDTTKTDTKDNTVNDDTTKTDTKDNTVNDDTTKTDTKDNTVNDDTTKTEKENPNNKASGKEKTTKPEVIDTLVETKASNVMPPPHPLTEVCSPKDTISPERDDLVSSTDESLVTADEDFAAVSDEEDKPTAFTSDDEYVIAAGTFSTPGDSPELRKPLPIKVVRKDISRDTSVEEEDAVYESKSKAAKRKRKGSNGSGKAVSTSDKTVSLDSVGKDSVRKTNGSRLEEDPGVIDETILDEMNSVAPIIEIIPNANGETDSCDTKVNPVVEDETSCRTNKDIVAGNDETSCRTNKDIVAGYDEQTLRKSRSIQEEDIQDEPAKKVTGDDTRNRKGKGKKAKKEKTSDSTKDQAIKSEVITNPLKDVKKDPEVSTSKDGNDLTSCQDTSVEKAKGKKGSGRKDEDTGKIGIDQICEDKRNTEEDRKIEDEENDQREISETTKIVHDIDKEDPVVVKCLPKIEVIAAKEEDATKQDDRHINASEDKEKQVEARSTVTQEKTDTQSDANSPSKSQENAKESAVWNQKAQRKNKRSEKKQKQTVDSKKPEEIESSDCSALPTDVTKKVESVTMDSLAKDCTCIPGSALANVPASDQSKLDDAAALVTETTFPVHVSSTLPQEETQVEKTADKEDDLVFDNVKTKTSTRKATKKQKSLTEQTNSRKDSPEKEQVSITDMKNTSLDRGQMEAKNDGIDTTGKANLNSPDTTKDDTIASTPKSQISVHNFENGPTTANACPIKTLPLQEKGSGKKTGRGKKKRGGTRSNSASESSSRESTPEESTKSVTDTNIPNKTSLSRIQCQNEDPLQSNVDEKIEVKSSHTLTSIASVSSTEITMEPACSSTAEVSGAFSLSPPTYIGPQGITRAAGGTWASRFSSRAGMADHKIACEDVLDEAEGTDENIAATQDLDTFTPSLENVDIVGVQPLSFNKQDITVPAKDDDESQCYANDKEPVDGGAVALKACSKGLVTSSIESVAEQDNSRPIEDSSSAPDVSKSGDEPLVSQEGSEQGNSVQPASSSKNLFGGSNDNMSSTSSGSSGGILLPRQADQMLDNVFSLAGESQDSS